MTISWNLKEAMDRRGLSIADLQRTRTADEDVPSQATLYRLRADAPDQLTLSVLDYLCQVLQTTPGELLHYTPTPTAAPDTSTGFVHLALAAHDSNDRQRRQEDERRFHDQQAIIARVCREVSLEYSAQLAAVLGADPDQPPFAELLWEIAPQSRSAVKVDVDTGTLESSGRVYMSTIFEQIPISACKLSDGFYTFNVATSVGSTQGFTDLATFGSAVRSKIENDERLARTRTPR